MTYNCLRQKELVYRSIDKISSYVVASKYLKDFEATYQKSWVPAPRSQTSSFPGARWRGRFSFRPPRPFSWPSSFPCHLVFAASWRRPRRQPRPRRSHWPQGKRTCRVNWSPAISCSLHSLGSTRKTTNRKLESSEFHNHEHEILMV